MILKTYMDLYRWLTSALSFRENAANESRWLIEHHTKKSFIEVRESPYFNEDFSAYFDEIEKLKEGCPFAYLLGEQEFYGLSFSVDENVLVPRPETELLVEEAIVWGKGKNISVLDVCTGSGCIIVSLAKNLHGDFFAVDISPNALGVAKKNAAKNEVSVSFFQSDLLAEIPKEKTFDLITSNPPYLTEAEMKEIPTELTYEPSLALYGGFDGLSLCNTLIEEVPRKLKEKGCFLMEIGEGQGAEVLKKAEEFFSVAVIRKDYNGKERFLSAIK